MIKKTYSPVRCAPFTFRNVCNVCFSFFYCFCQQTGTTENDNKFRNPENSDERYELSNFPVKRKIITSALSESKSINKSPGCTNTIKSVLYIIYFFFLIIIILRQNHTQLIFHGADLQHAQCYSVVQKILTKTFHSFNYFSAASQKTAAAVRCSVRIALSCWAVYIHTAPYRALRQQTIHTRSA